jgi:spore maturation protein CgeB
MKILIYEWNSFGIEDVCEALTAMSHTYKVVSDEELQSRVSAGFDERFEKEISEGYDCVFTFNYSPVLSNNCKKHDIPYISFIYDSPQVLLYSYTLINPCNYVFIFDKQQFMEFKKNGINTVYYAPLAANPKRLAKQINDVKASPLAGFFKSDISFVGSMYNEKHNLFDRFKDLPPYISGYLEAIMQAQMKVYGYYFLDKLLSPEIIRELEKSVPLEPNKDGVETVQYLYSEYFLSRKMACMERHELLGKLSENFNVNLFTYNPTPELPKITNKGAIDYYIDMPSVFGCSKINLNITLHSIKSGIPLRCMDIMGAGGFLLSNFL